VIKLEASEIFTQKRGVQVYEGDEEEDFSSRLWTDGKAEVYVKIETLF
jgi:hypothetical protein